MTQEFTLDGFATFLAEVAIEVEHENHKALERAAVVIEDEAKAEIGFYQGEAGPYPAWAELADSTKAQRVALGYTENDPGLRSGAMRDSIQHTIVSEHEVQIGSNDDHLVYFELGTNKQPPRPVLGLAAFQKGKEAAEAAGGVLIAAMTGSATDHQRIEVSASKE